MMSYDSKFNETCAAKSMKRYSPKRIFWLCLGLLSFGLGAIGAFLPLLPTTSFMLLAAFCFAKSSPKLHSWLLAHKMFGALILNWNQHGAISLHAKIVSLISMAFILGLSLIFKAPSWVILTQGFIVLCVSLFLWTRPAPPKSE